MINLSFFFFLLVQRRPRWAIFEPCPRLAHPPRINPPPRSLVGLSIARGMLYHSGCFCVKWSEEMNEEHREGHRHRRAPSLVCIGTQTESSPFGKSHTVQ